MTSPVPPAAPEGVPVAWAVCYVRRGFNDDAAKPKLLFDSPERAEDVARRQTAFGAGEGARFIVRPVAWFTEPKPVSLDVARICDESAEWWRAKADDPSLPHDVRMFAIARASGAQEVKGTLVAAYDALLSRLAAAEGALARVRGVDVDLVLLAAANAVSYASRGEPMPDATALGILARSLRDVRDGLAKARTALGAERGRG